MSTKDRILQRSRARHGRTHTKSHFLKTFLYLTVRASEVDAVQCSQAAVRAQHGERSSLELNSASNSNFPLQLNKPFLSLSFSIWKNLHPYRGCPRCARQSANISKNDLKMKRYVFLI